MNSNEGKLKTKFGQRQQSRNNFDSKKISNQHFEKTKEKSLNRMEKTVATNLDDLPPEILLKIIGYLSLNDIEKNVRQVSSRMSDLSKDPSVGISVKFDRRSDPDTVEKIFESKKSFQIKELTWNVGIPKQSFDFFTKNISCLYNLMSLEISAGEKLTSTFMKQIFQMKTLRELNIKSPIEESSLANIDQCQSLNRLELKSLISEQELAAITKLKNLSFLTVRVVIETTNQEVKWEISHCDASLKFEIELITEDFFDKVTSSFPNMTGLRIYKGLFEMASRGEIKSLVTSLRRCPNWMALQLDCKISDINFFRSHFQAWIILYQPTSSATLIMCKHKRKRSKYPWP